MDGRQRVVGVDFSGARNAGKLIWIARGALAGEAVRIESCVPARDLSGGATERAPAMTALVEWLAGETDAVIGLDFPFSLPVSLIPDQSWEDFITAFPARYVNAQAFRATCMDAAAGRELKRRTDVETRVPFSAYNLRLYRQTFEGIANVLHPLVTAGRVRAVPTQPPADGLAVLAETCPASLLKAEGLYGSYKGSAPALKAARKAIVAALETRGLLAPLTPGLRRLLIDDKGGDALDAAIAAIAAARAIRDPTATRPRDDLEAIETRVFY